MESKDKEIQALLEQMQSERLAQAVKEQLEQSKQEMREQISGLSARIQNYKDDYKEQMESDREAHRVDREFVIDVIDGMMPGGKERFAQAIEAIFVRDPQDLDAVA